MKIAEQKRELLKKLLHEGGHAKVIISPQTFGVLLPESLQDQDTVVLGLSWKLPWLSLQEDGIYARMTFQGELSVVSLPWECVTGIQDSKKNIYGFDKDLMLAVKEHFQRSAVLH